MSAPDVLPPLLDFCDECRSPHRLFVDSIKGWLCYACYKQAGQPKLKEKK